MLLASDKAVREFRSYYAMDPDEVRNAVVIIVGVNKKTQYCHGFLVDGRQFRSDLRLCVMSIAHILQPSYTAIAGVFPFPGSASKQFIRLDTSSAIIAKVSDHMTVGLCPIEPSDIPFLDHASVLEWATDLKPAAAHGVWLVDNHSKKAKYHYQPIVPYGSPENGLSTLPSEFDPCLSGCPMVDLKFRFAAMLVGKVGKDAIAVSAPYLQRIVAAEAQKRPRTAPDEHKTDAETSFKCKWVADSSIYVLGLDASSEARLRLLVQKPTKWEQWFQKEQPTGGAYYRLVSLATDEAEASRLWMSWDEKKRTLFTAESSRAIELWQECIDKEEEQEGKTPEEVLNILRLFLERCEPQNWYGILPLREARQRLMKKYFSSSEDAGADAKDTTQAAPSQIAEKKRETMPRQGSILEEVKPRKIKIDDPDLGPFCEYNAAGELFKAEQSSYSERVLVQRAKKKGPI